VQLTQDNALVILHDIDLARIGGGNRRVDAVTLETLRTIDIGAAVDQKFAGERVPTLEEMLTAAGHEIRMNVELKPHGHADETALTERVVAAIQQAGMVDRCRLCSQSYASLQLARRLAPSLPIGFIVATSIGDLTRLDVDFLMVKAELVTRYLVERAAANKIRVHAWTVNDPSWLAPLLDAGIANVITDDPALMRSRFDEIRSLSPVQRLLLRARSEFLKGS
jgi:glycerophosphoryl diester phosphodiesterase